MMIILFFIIGFFFLLVGFWTISGRGKTLYLAIGTPIFIPRAIQNMFIPLGITFLAWSIVFLIPGVETRRNLFVFVVMPIMFISIILGAWNPRWLRPKWLNFLEDEYGTVMYKLLEEAREDPKSWSHQTRTQAGLEGWAEETRLKLGYPPHPGQIERQYKNK